MRRLIPALIAFALCSGSRADDPLVNIYGTNLVTEQRQFADGEETTAGNEVTEFLLHIAPDKTQDFAGHDGAWSRKRKGHYAFDNTSDFAADIGLTLPPGVVLKSATQRCREVELWIHAIHGPFKQAWKFRDGAVVGKVKIRGAFVGAIT